VTAIPDDEEAKNCVASFPADGLNAFAALPSVVGISEQA
jgi:hypothetical protein